MKPGLMLANNLEDLADTIGGFLGMAEGLERKEYMHAILTRAFRTADRRFNVATEAVAKSNHLEHMYEHGTTGITYGEPKFKATHQRARLWKTVAQGAAGRKLITYVFRPATQPNPPHTTESTGGVDQDTLNLLKVNKKGNGGEKYFWRNRAEATEKGHRIFIKGHQPHGLLFVPVNQGLHNPKPYEEERGYGLRKEHIYTPGEESEGLGQFERHFLGWWSSAGATSMTNSLIQYVNRDVKEFGKTIGIKRGGIKPASQVRIDAAANEGYEKTRKQFWLKVSGHLDDKYRDEDQKII